MGYIFKIYKSVAFLILFVIGNVTIGMSQVKGDFVIVTDEKYKVFGGRVIKTYERFLRIRDTLNGNELEFFYNEAKKIEVNTFEEFQYKKSRYDSRYRHYFAVPSAIGLKKKQLEYRNLMIGYNQVSEGITDYLMLSEAALPELFDLGSSVGFCFTLHSQVGRNAYVSASGSFLNEFDYDFSNLGPKEKKYFMHFAKFTYGSPRNNITLGGSLGNGETKIGILSWKIGLRENWFLYNDNTYFRRDDVFYGLLGTSYNFRRFIFSGGILFKDFFPANQNYYTVVGVSMLFGKR